MSRAPVTILHLRPSNFVGGPERQILRYCRAAAAGPWRQVVATFTRPGAGPEGEGQAWLAALASAGVPGFALPGGGWRDLEALAALDRLIVSEGVGLICAHGYRADLLGLIAARRRGIRLACFLRGWTGEDRKVRVYESADRALLGLADRVVCLSQSQAAALPRRVRRDRVRTVVNAVELVPVDREAARAELRRRFRLANGDAPVAAIAGRLSPEKGAAVFLEAAARVLRERPEVRFLVFGDGPMRPALEQQATRLGLDGQLQFAGHVPDWHRLLPGLDLLVNPSLTEQAPNVVLEGMAAGVPLVATSVGAVAEIAGRDSGAPCVALVPPAHPLALAGAMLELLAAPGRRTALGDSARARVQEAYAPEHQGRQLAALYQELLPAPAAQAAPAAAEAEALPTVSVVLPVLREARHLGGLLDQLLAQDYPAERFEVLIADGGAGAAGDDGTTALGQAYAARYPGRVRWLPNPRRRSSAGRNVGIAAARGAWVVFVDGHCELPGDGWLRESMRAASASGALCLSRPQPLTAGMRGGWQAAIAHARASRIGHGADSTIFDAGAAGWVNPSSSGACYHASLLASLGGYDESFDACEDVEFNHRLAQAGVRAWLAPEAVVYYAARASLGGLWRQMVRYGRGRRRLMRKHRDAFSIPQSLPAAWLAGAPLALVGAGFAPAPVAAACAAGLLLYAGVVATSAVAVGRRAGWRNGWAAPAVFLTIHAGLGAGFWRETLQPVAGRGDARRRASAGALPQDSASRSTS